MLSGTWYILKLHPNSQRFSRSHQGKAFSSIHLCYIHRKTATLFTTKIKLHQMEKNHEVALSHLRKSVEKLGSSAEKYEDPTLMRFLISRSMDSEEAAKMFVQWQKWRSEFVPSGYISDFEVKDELEARKFYLQGISTKGFPILMVKASSHFPIKDHTQFTKLVVHLLEKTIASSFGGKEIGNEKVVYIVDMKGMSFKNVDVRASIISSQILQAYYPERLAKSYILNMPGFFVRFWRIISRLLDKATVEKIVFVNTVEEKGNFINEIGEEALPEEYGGRSKFIPFQDVALPPWIH